MLTKINIKDFRNMLQNKKCHALGYKEVLMFKCFKRKMQWHTQGEQVYRWKATKVLYDTWRVQLTNNVTRGNDAIIHNWRKTNQICGCNQIPGAFLHVDMDAIAYMVIKGLIAER